MLKSMKKSFVIIIGLALFIISCASSGVKENKYLGKIPGLVAKYKTEKQKQEEKIASCKDYTKVRELDDELKALQKKADSELDAYLKEATANKVIPFEGLPDMPYTIESVEINNVSTYTLNLKFNISILKEGYSWMNKLFVYFKAVDSNGSEIPGTKTVASTASRKDPVVGELYQIFGGWTTNDVINLSDFAKVVEISKEEYNAK